MVQPPHPEAGLHAVPQSRPQGAPRPEVVPEPGEPLREVPQPAAVPPATAAPAASSAPTSSEAAPAGPAPAQAAPAPAPALSGGPSLQDVISVWGGVLDNLRGRDQLCAVALERARPVELDGSELTIAFPTDAAFYRGTADREERRLALREALREVTGVALSARFELRDLQAPPADDPYPDDDDAGPHDAPAAPGASAHTPPPAPTQVPPLGSTATLDESAVVAHLVTEFDAEELSDPDQEPA
ncbi:MAG: hypothetical protein JHD16_03725 [Solirubrobacteraceae bacterium]|nr:hypothetical protein [Solirubrobacteraceae bacterium]